jgi:hypothetical protein
MAAEVAAILTGHTDAPLHSRPHQHRAAGV